MAALIDQGFISSLDDDICNVLPNGQSTACRHYDFPNVPITWRMLVTHRSSLLADIPGVVTDTGRDVRPSYGPSGGYSGQAAGNPMCPLTDVKGFYMDFLTDKETTTTVGFGVKLEGGRSLNWYEVGEDDGGAYELERPGSLSLYSNFAIGYIAALVEFATGQSFNDFCKSNLFDRLGMEHTSWFREDLPGGTPVAVPVESLENGQFSDYGHYW